MAKVLVLGGNGFIGSHLIDSLIADGHEVTCFTKLDGQPATNLVHLQDNIRIIDGDFADTDQLDGAIKGNDYVFHMLSFSTPASTIDDHFIDIQKNVIGTIKLLELCVKHNIKKIIYPSSGGAIYGNQLKERLDENAPTEPVSLYGISKLTIENYLRYFSNVHGLDYMIFRISNPFGPRQNPRGAQGLIAVSLLAIKEGRPLRVYGDGNNTRDYIYVTDAADLMARAFDMETQHKLYNLGSGVGYSINDILSIYRTRMGFNFEVDKYPARESDVLRIILDVDRLSEFQFQPKVGFEEGIEATWESINKQYK